MPAILLVLRSCRASVGASYIGERRVMLGWIWHAGNDLHSDGPSDGGQGGSLVPPHTRGSVSLSLDGPSDDGPAGVEVVAGQGAAAQVEIATKV